MAGTSDAQVQAIEKWQERIGTVPVLKTCFWIVAAYLAWNSDPIFKWLDFDPYPFNFLTTTVSLIAIFQALMLQIGQVAELVRGRRAKKIQDATLNTLLENSKMSIQIAQSYRESLEADCEHRKAVIAALEHIIEVLSEK